MIPNYLQFVVGCSVLVQRCLDLITRYVCCIQILHPHKLEDFILVRDSWRLRIECVSFTFSNTLKLSAGILETRKLKQINKIYIYIYNMSKLYVYLNCIYICGQTVEILLLYRERLNEELLNKSYLSLHRFHSLHLTCHCCWTSVLLSALKRWRFLRFPSLS